MLLVYCKYDHKLLAQLYHCANGSLDLFFRTRARPLLLIVVYISGIIMVHPYLHAIVADGLFRPNGTFLCLPKRDLKELEEIFRSKVLAMPKREGKIHDEFIEKLMGCPPARRAYASETIAVDSACMPVIV